MKHIVLAVGLSLMSLSAMAATTVVPVQPVKEAHCEPQLDDACTVNNKKVPKAQLGKYLPTVDPDQVSAEGGYCEYPVCYNEADEPVGIRSR